jgi:hypothetical protein
MRRVAPASRPTAGHKRNLYIKQSQAFDILKQKVDEAMMHGDKAVRSTVIEIETELSELEADSLTGIPYYETSCASLEADSWTQAESVHQAVPSIRYPQAVSIPQIDSLKEHNHLCTRPAILISKQGLHTFAELDYGTCRCMGCAWGTRCAY